MKLGLCYRRPRLALPGALALLVALAGCSNSSRYPKDLKYPLRKDLIVRDGQKAKPTRHLPPPGHLDDDIAKLKEVPDAKVIDPAELKEDQRAELRAALRDVFGTPAAPTVDVLGEGGDSLPGETGLALFQFGNKSINKAVTGGKMASAGEIDDLELDSGSLSRGSALYRRHCLHCHGVSGDGRGPTGPWVHPHPRDYRQGLFKFVSTHARLSARKPRRADLLRTLQRGIDGTSMPAFGLLPESQLRQLASYVTHLSIRGEVELLTMTALLTNEPLTVDEDAEKIFSADEGLKDSPIKKFVRWKTAELVSQWAYSSSAPPTAAPPYPEKYQVEAAATADARKTRQDELEKSVRNGHKLFLGKGICATCHLDYGRQSEYRYDSWGTLVRPRNLTEGQYRGGRRPIDLFWRVSGGIEPSGMPSKPPVESPGKDDLSTEEYWDLINFVQALPYPPMLPADVREKVYGPGK